MQPTKTNTTVVKTATDKNGYHTLALASTAFGYNDHGNVDDGIPRLK